MHFDMNNIMLHEKYKFLKIFMTLKGAPSMFQTRSTRAFCLFLCGANVILALKSKRAIFVFSTT